MFPSEFCRLAATGTVDTQADEKIPTQLRLSPVTFACVQESLF